MLVHWNSKDAALSELGAIGHFQRKCLPSDKVVSLRSLHFQSNNNSETDMLLC